MDLIIKKTNIPKELITNSWNEMAIKNTGAVYICFCNIESSILKHLCTKKFDLYSYATGIECAEYDDNGILFLSL